MSVTSLDEITNSFESLRNKAMEVGTLIDLRHKLTANIQFNLYGGGDKGEGRKALAVRNALDETIFGTTDADLVDPSKGGIEQLKRAISLENLSEKMQILEGVARNAKAIGMKAELVNLLTDGDRFDRFSAAHQIQIKAGATGFSFLANWRINKVIDALQLEARNYI